MRRIALLSVMLALAACQNSDPGAYHPDLAHPYRVSERSVKMSLAGMDIDTATAKALAFAGERPNNGSSFIVAAPMETAAAVKIALTRVGVDPRDIRVIPEGSPAEVIRVDRLAGVDGCRLAPERKDLRSYLWNADEGFTHDNANADTFGCAVRRNKAEMIDDPRTLEGPQHNQGRDGGRAGKVYEAYGKGESPASKAVLPNTGTSSSTLSGGGK